VTSSQGAAGSGRGLHRAGPLPNLFLLIALVASVLTGPGLIAECIVLATIVTLAAASGEPPARLVYGLRYVLFFALVLFLAHVLSVRDGRVLLATPIRVTVDGLLIGARMALRFLAILSASALFVRTTDPDRLAGGLIRRGVPYRYGYLLVLALRFVPFFQEELRAVREAQRVRGIEVSVRSPRRVLHAVRYTFVPVVVSGLHRVESISISMKGRCFGLYATRTASRREARSSWSLLAVGLGLVAVGLATAARLGRWGV
jgi:energy-coupling factor transport system permease protein